MHLLLLLSIALQIACAVHAVRTGRPMYWLFILLIGSYIAVAIYVIAEVLPEMRSSRTTRRTIGGLRDRVDPERGKRQAAHRLDLADTRHNRCVLAEQSMRTGDYQQALELYRSALTGIYANDPQIMLEMAKAQFALGQPEETRGTLEALIAVNPDFRSTEGHLLYARAVEAGGDTAAALHEYEALATSYPGEEARMRYAMLLKQAGDAHRAAALFRETLTRAKVSPRHYRRAQREWIALAERELG